MKLSLFRTGRKLSVMMPMLCLAASCVYINEELGKEYIPTRHQYDVYVKEFELKDIKMKPADSLSAYSSSRITIGSVMDPVFGLTTKSSAFTLIPISKELDFGENPVIRQFHFSAVKDTVSFPDASQEQIIQNINVFALDEEIGEDDVYVSSGKNLKIGKRISNGIPLYTGGDSLSFDFSEEFGQMYIDKLKSMTLDSVSNYVKVLPGIYLSVDDQTSTGGRINLFNLSIEIQDSYYISGSYAELKFTSTYGTRENVDTSFLFFFGAQDMSIYQEAESMYANDTRTPQYALNLSVHQTGTIPETASDRIYVEGGGGVKPVISAKELTDSCLALFAKDGINPEAVIINKASLVLPFDFPHEDGAIDRYPVQLSPTCRIRTTDSEDANKKYVSFAGLTDTSIDTEDPGDINRSLCCYTPDIGHHLQEILRLSDDEDADISQYDIWLLIMALETVEESSSSSMNDYYSNLLYYNYLNSIYDPYGYGYGGYGGYYGYGYGGYNSYYGYNNYINYALAAQYSSNQSSGTTTYQLDRDRYYAGILRGPDSDGDGNKPRVRITYSVSKTANRN